MTKKFIKDNRGQVLYAVLVAVMFVSVLSMIALGLSLQHYYSAQQKQAHIVDYYAADAVAELIRVGAITVSDEEVKLNAESFAVATDEDKRVILVKKDGETQSVKNDENVDIYTIDTYVITVGTVTLTVGIQTPTDAPQETKFNRWEVRYHEVETEASEEPDAVPVE